MKLKYLLPALIPLLVPPTNAWSADATIVLGDNGTVDIHGNGDTAGNILASLAKLASIEISGDLAPRTDIIDYRLNEPVDDAIQHLVQPQSVVLTYSGDGADNRRVSRVELLPAGKEDSQYLNNGKVRGFKDYSRMDPEKARFHMERDLRRQQRHAQGLGRVNQPNNGLVTREEALEAKKQQ